MKTYDFEVTYRVDCVGIDGKNKTDARNTLKELFKDEHNITLRNSEIEEISG